MENRKAAIEWFSMLKEKFVKTEYEGYLDMAISALEKQEKDRWIPVTERLPEYGQVVMWCNENGSVFSSAITYKRGDDWAIGKRHRYKKVLAWRPLPEPYQEDKE